MATNNLSEIYKQAVKTYLSPLISYIGHVVVDEDQTVAAIRDIFKEYKEAISKREIEDLKLYFAYQALLLSLDFLRNRYPELKNVQEDETEIIDPDTGLKIKPLKKIREGIALFERTLREEAAKANSQDTQKSNSTNTRRLF